MMDDLDRVRHFISNNLEKKYELILKELKEKHLRQMYDELNVKDTNITNIEIKDNKICINVKLISRYMDYKVDEKFNVVVIANALHIMPQPEKALKEIHRVLKKDGILFAPTFVYERGYPKLPIWLMEKAGFKTYHKWQSEELKEYVGSEGFQVVGAALIKGKPLSECVLVAKKSID